MKKFTIACLFMVIGSLVMYTMAYVHNSGWKIFYGIWDKTKDFLLVYAGYCLLVSSRRWLFLPVVIFTLIRALWALVAFYRGYSVNDPVAISILFILLTGVCIIFMLGAFVKWRTRRL